MQSEVNLSMHAHKDLYRYWSIMKVCAWMCLIHARKV